MKPLTAEQRRLAEKNHDLVYKFLNDNHLSEDLYYDVVIFGYLCAVREYCDCIELKKYSFATVAWKKMQSEVKDYIKYLNRGKRDFSTVSLYDFKGQEETSRHIEEIIAMEKNFIEDLETKMLLQTLADRVPKKHMRIIQMKLDGYRMHDIAKAEHMTFRDINILLEDIYDKVLELINC